MRKWFEAYKKLSIMWQSLLPIPHSSYCPFLSVESFCTATHQGGFLLFLGPEQGCCLPHGSPQPSPTFSMLASQTLVPGKSGGQEQSCKHVHLIVVYLQILGLVLETPPTLLQLWKFRCGKGLRLGDQNTYKLAIIPQNVVSC